MKRYLILFGFIVLWQSTRYLHAQGNDNSPYNFYMSDGYISSYAIDSLNDIIYIGGQFTSYMGQQRNNLAAIDAKTGKLLPWNPSANNTVTAMVYVNNGLVVVGYFTKINNQAVKNMACILPDGSMKPNWPAFLTSYSLADPNQAVMTADESFIYLSCTVVSGTMPLSRFCPIDVITGKYYWTWDKGTNIPDIGMPLYAIQKKGDYVYGLAQDQDIYVFNCKDTAWVKRIPVDSLVSGKCNAKMMFVEGNTAYVSGSFVINGKDYQVIGINLQTRELIYGQLNLLPGAACKGITLPCNSCPNNPFSAVYTMSSYKGQFLLGGNMVDNLSKQCKSGSAFYTSQSLTDSLNTFNAPPLFESHSDYSLRQFSVYKKRLYMISRWTNGKYSDTLAAYCLTGLPPDMKKNYAVTVCPGQTGVPYEISSPDAGAKYIWQYTGKDVTIKYLNANATSVTLDFDTSATSGVLKVYESDVTCSPKGADREISITLLSRPYVNAGTDKVLNCNTTNVILNGNSTNNPKQWLGPNGVKGADSTFKVSVPGTYIYTITDLFTGCKNSDAAVVTLDTTTTQPVPYNGLTELTCKKNNLLLDAASLYPAHGLRWVLPDGTTKANPIKINLPGYYKIIVHRENNGCESSSVVNVTTNYTPPALSLSKNTFAITCTENPVLLEGEQTTPGVVVVWKTPDGDTLKKPAYASKAGVYLAIATDPASGCSKSQAATVIEDLTKPDALLPTPLPEINCSTDSAFLKGSSSFKNVDVYWIAADGQFRNDSTWVKDTGLYVLHVINKDNGCVAENSFPLKKSNTLLINAKDTSVCNGSSVLLKVFPVKGTPAFSYLWENGLTTPTINVNPKDTTIYKVSVSDAAGCAGIAAVKVKPAPALMDSVKTFQSCDPAILSGELQVYAYGGTPPYTYSVDGGLHWQDKKIFSKIPYGNYDIVIKDAMGCYKKDTASISKLSSTVDVNFLVATNLFKTDTFIVVDVSNPRPDSVSWDFPAECTLLNKDPFAPMLVNKDTGAFTITMHAHYQSCERILSKKVKIIPMDSAFMKAKGKFGIEEIKAYPNPTNGAFSCEIKLFVPQDVAVMVYDPNAQEIYRHVTANSDYVIEKIDLQSAGNGYYVLKIIAEHDAKSLLIMVQQ